MCINSSSIPRSPLRPNFSHPQPSKRQNLRIGCLSRRRRLLKEAKEKRRMRIVKTQMEIKNLKLYMKNRSIIEENEMLRQKVLLLHEEHQTLLFQLQKRLSQE
ncbi:hypothetical protein CJ030_MR3G015152 [Morella rubra]|uniref:Protein LITTLE ZIPPER 2 n=1 Tax=Morella rubra TaxID=262757 RepID=A0A6A1W136_9ROSI|nr:hypothetical protein CJ030_MR3G015152 [Morella rubra]